MRANLPNPPPSSGKFVANLIAKLTDLFRRINPASGWQDLTASMYTAKIGSSKPPTWEVMVNGIYAYNFADGDDDQAFLAFHIPHDIASSYTDEEGNVGPTRIYPHVHWSPKSNAVTGTVRFGIEYTYAKGYGDGVYPATTTIYIEQTVTSATALTHFIAETNDASCIEDALLETDGLMMVRVFRDGAHANDDIGSDVYVTFMDLHYFSDGLLTNERNRNATGLRWTKRGIL